MFSLFLSLLLLFVANSKTRSFGGALLDAISNDDDVDIKYFEDYVAYAQKFGKDKKYDLDDEDELKRRYQNYYNAQIYINTLTTKSLTFEVGHTKFSDLDDEEKKSVLMQDFVGSTSTSCTQLTMSTYVLTNCISKYSTKLHKLHLFIQIFVFFVYFVLCFF